MTYNRKRPQKSNWGSVDSVLLIFVSLLVIAFAVSTAERLLSKSDGVIEIEQRVIKVQVLNGCGENGAAEQVTQVLRNRGFDVLYYGNAESFDNEQTVVFDHQGRPEFAELVAKTIGCRNIVFRQDERLRLDVTILLGRDWRENLNGEKEISLFSILREVFGSNKPARN